MISNFDDLINIGKLERKVSIGGHEFTLSTLSTAEYADMARRFPAPDEKLADAERFEAVQRITLAHVCTAVDGNKLSLDDRHELMKKVQLGVSNRLYDEYMGMMSEQDKMLDDAKKNSSQSAVPLI